MESGKDEPILVLDEIKKNYGDVVVLDGVSASINQGELVTFVGPSGCGKTTLLRIIGGFTTPDGGRVILDGEVSNDKPPYARDTAIVFQNYALFPHLTVVENIGYGLKIRKWKRSEIEEKVQSLLRLVELEGLGDRGIDKLSGGQQQRVALARALSLEPKILLLDEPLSNLDASLRLTMRHEIRNLQEKLNLTTVLVTHDQDEAMSLSDRIMLLSGGAIQQIGSPADMYERPSSWLTANFMGETNFLEGRVRSYDEPSGLLTVVTAIGEVYVTPEGIALEKDDEVVLMVRPENIDLLRKANGQDGNKFRGIIESSMYVGSRVEYSVKVGETNLRVFHFNPRRVGIFDGEVTIEIPGNLHILKR